MSMGGAALALNWIRSSPHTITQACATSISTPQVPGVRILLSRTRTAGQIIAPLQCVQL
jgi:hypothetical protein